MSPDYVTLADGLPWIIGAWTLLAGALVATRARGRK